jgi:GT2 family glycosyltransferase
VNRGTAVIAYVHGGTVRAEFMASLLGLMMNTRVRVEAVDELGSGPNISRARNTLAWKFLDMSSAEWLLMADTDMVFAHDALDRLVAAADPDERPVVGALCFSRHPDTGDAVSTMYEAARRDGQLVFIPYREWPQDAVVRVDATGAAFLLVHRAALESVAVKTAEPAAPWFRESVIGSQLIGEDLTFCLRAADAGIPVHVHTGVQAAHIKTSVLGKVT